MLFLAPEGGGDERQRREAYDAAAGACDARTRSALPAFDAIDDLLSGFEAISLDGDAAAAPTCTQCGCSVVAVDGSGRPRPMMYYRADAYCGLDCLFDAPDPQDGRPLYASRPGLCMHLDALNTACLALEAARTSGGCGGGGDCGGSGSGSGSGGAGERNGGGGGGRSDRCDACHRIQCRCGMRVSACYSDDYLGK
jgi:hypothetical protein